MFGLSRKRLRKVQKVAGKKENKDGVGKTRVTFVIPIYNMCGYISQTLDSLLDQTLKDIEIIVVDDGSTDGLFDLIKYYHDKDKRVQYKRFPKRGGAGRCRNAGNKLARAPIICVCDAGDIYTRWRAEIAYEYFEKHPSVSVLACACAYRDQFDEVDFNDIRMPRAYRAKPGERLKFEHPAVAYRRQVTQKWFYRDDCIDTDQYDAFFFTVGRDGFKFGVTDDIVCFKQTLVNYKHGRNWVVARLKRIDAYREFGVDIPRGYLEFEQKYRKTKS